MMVGHLVDVWNAMYSSHPVLRTGVEFVHIGGLLAGGGCAVTADLATISAARDSSAARSTELRVLKRTHGLVVAGLAALFASGALLFFADVDTYLHSRLFWIKMGLLAVLLGNGVVVLLGERRVTRGDAQAWRALHRAAVTSLLLWFATTLLGAALPNIG
jgi:uncharacterized membrane protein